MSLTVKVPGDGAGVAGARTSPAGWVPGGVNGLFVGGAVCDQAGALSAEARARASRRRGRCRVIVTSGRGGTIVVSAMVGRRRSLLEVGLSRRGQRTSCRMSL